MCVAKPALFQIQRKLGSQAQVECVFGGDGIFCVPAMESCGSKRRAQPWVMLPGNVNENQNQSPPDPFLRRNCPNFSTLKTHTRKTSQSHVQFYKFLDLGNPFVLVLVLKVLLPRKTLTSGFTLLFCWNRAQTKEDGFVGHSMNPKKAIAMKNDPVKKSLWGV